MKRERSQAVAQLALLEMEAPEDRKPIDRLLAYQIATVWVGNGVNGPFWWRGWLYPSDRRAWFDSYREMIVPSAPSWVEEHVRRLSAARIQSAFQFYNINSYETVERMIRRGVYKGPLVMNWVAISGGMDAPNIYNLANFLRAVPDGSMLTVESSMRNVLPINMMGMAMGLHVRCGIEDNLWTQDRKAKMSTVKQIEQLVRLSREFGREVASGKEAREICKIGVFYDSIEETLAQNGFAPNARPGLQGFLRKAA